MATGSALTPWPGRDGRQTASASSAMPRDVEDAVVAALVAALVASFRREPMATVKPPRGTDRRRRAA